jgi:hypothetical protein
MAEESKRWYRRRNTPVLIGPIWIIGWLFTVGYAGLVWWEILLGLIIWPYFLGRALG